MSASLATFSPTCLHVNRQRAPAYAAPAKSSSAAFSFVDHSTCTSRAVPAACSFAIVSMTSDDGVPGYPAATRTPASSAAWANASLPISSFFAMIFVRPALVTWSNRSRYQNRCFT